jgi:iron complex outermembrane recepter protein
MKVALSARIPANKVTCPKTGRKAHALSGKAVRAFDLSAFMKNIFLQKPLIAACLSVLASQAAQAQAFHALEAAQIVVTATRFAEPMASLPLGVSVLTAQQIQASGVTTVNEALMKLLGVPGRQDSYGGGDYALDLRGFGATADSNQVIVLDGLRLNEADTGGTRLAGIAIDTVERIEVLRGSGSVLYGEGATGGVIHITTKAGHGLARQNSATVYGALGSHDLKEVRANATLASGGFSLDLNGSRRESDNHRDNFHSNTEAAGLTAQWASDSLRLGARYDQDVLKTGLPGSLSAQQYADNPQQTDTPLDRATIRNERRGLFAESSVSDWTLAVDAGWRDKLLESNSSGYVYAYDVEAKQLALKARRVSQWNGVSNTLILGHDRHDWRRLVKGTYGSLADQSTRAWYLKDDIVLASGTRFSVGVRTESLDKQVDDGFVPIRLSERQNAWELGISQALTTALTAWTRWGSSFRLANVDEFSYTNPAVPIRPQTSQDVELGARWTEGAYKFEARAYRSQLTDEIGYDPNVVTALAYPGANINFDATRRQGMELHADWTLNPQWRLAATAAWRQSTFRAGPYLGKDVPLAPRQSLSLRTDWTPQHGHRLSGGLNLVSSQHPDFENACRMPSYGTVDARYALQHQNMELSLGVNNLLDRSYYTQAFRCAGGVTSAIYPEAGRTVTVGLRVSF